VILPDVIHPNIAIILKRGRVGQYIRKLIQELRTTMYPYTAINLKESKANSIKDFLSIVDIYGLSHMMMLTNTEKASYMRMAKMPRGPTITMKVNKYCLAADVYEHLNSADKPAKPLTKSFNHVPLVIMNGFNKNIPEEFKLPVETSAMLIQSLFPPLNLSELQLKNCKRVVLFNLRMDDEPVIEFRHFDIDIERHSIKKTISNIINNKKTDLSSFNNISDYILKQTGYTSCSDNEEAAVEIIEDKNKDDNKVKVKLVEIGPRIDMKVVKIEEGFLKGNVVYHSHIKKSKKEIKETMESIKEKKVLKKQRKEEQQTNVAKKEDDKYNAMTDEQKEEYDRQKRREERKLGKKRRREEREKKQEEEEKEYEVMDKFAMKRFQKLKKGK
jgi:ribosome biogenesis protein SSF1/2